MPVRVLNTRPADRAPALTSCLIEHGFEVMCLPLLGFERCELSPTERSKILPAQAYDVAIVVSPIAAEYGLQMLHEHQQAAHHYAKHWIAVGQATAQVLARAGLSVEVPTLENSEGVLALPSLILAKGARVLVWRGHGGRELIQHSLFAQGVEVQTLELYRRYLPPTSVMQWAQGSQKPDVVLLSSGEAWQNWQQLAQEFATAPLLLVYGERLVQTLSSQAKVVALSSLQPQHIVDALNQQMMGDLE